MKPAQLDLDGNLIPLDRVPDGWRRNRDKACGACKGGGERDGRRCMSCGGSGFNRDRPDPAKGDIPF